VSLSHTIESYLRVVIAYWWALLPGLLMPLIDAINWPRAEEKKNQNPDLGEIGCNHRSSHGRTILRVP
jgi:hypothetical protein